MDEITYSLDFPHNEYVCEEDIPTQSQFEELVMARAKYGIDVFRLFALEKASIAESESTSPDTLYLLGCDTSEDVRVAVAGNPNTPPDMLWRLYRNWSVRVRKAVAGNRSVPFELLLKMLNDNKDEIGETTRCVASNPQLPVDDLRELAKSDNPYIRSGVARNPATPRDVLAVLSEDEDMLTRVEVAGNPNTPKPIVERLFAEDESNLVVKPARHTLDCLERAKTVAAIRCELERQRQSVFQ